jgi:hypothetical protein
MKRRLPPLSRTFVRGFLSGVLVMLIADLGIVLALAAMAGAGG